MLMNIINLKGWNEAVIRRKARRWKRIPQTRNTRENTVVVVVVVVVVVTTSRG